MKHLGRKFPLSRPAFAVLLFPLTAFLTSAQTTSTATPASGANPPPPGGEEATILLSPFEVNAEQDSGYQATNTTSGSRLASSLKDTAAAIEPFTAEFIADIAAISVEELLPYATNWEQGGDAAGNGLPPEESDERGGSGFRIRSLNGQSSVDYVNTAAPSDLYNIERAEISSGANSILFGASAAGGLVSLTTKKGDVRRDKYVTTASFGRWSFERYTADLNKVLLPGKLAVRLNAVYGDEEGWRRFDFKDNKRYTISAAYRPFARTAFHAAYEDGKAANNVTARFNPWDLVTRWLDAGSPVYDGAADTARGTRSFGGNQRFTLFPQDGSVHNMRNELATLSGLTTIVDHRTLLPREIFPLEINWFGPRTRLDRDFSKYQFSVDQQVGDKLSLQAAYFHNETVNTADTLTFTANPVMYLHGDPNLSIAATNGTGTVANPGAGGLFFEGVQKIGVQSTSYDVARVTAAYDLNLPEISNWGKWLGHHRVVALFENESNELFNNGGMTEILTDQNGVPIANAGTPENDQNRLYRRSYLTTGDQSTYAHTNLFTPLAPFAYTNGRTISSRMVPGSAPNEALSETDSLVLVVQSRFALPKWLGQRLNTTFGYRKDDRFFQQRENGRLTDTSDPRLASGELILNQRILLDSYQEPLTVEPITRTLGGVWHLHRRFSVFYNQSSNTGFDTNRFLNRFLPDDGSHPPAGGLVPGPLEGDTSDYGLMVDLLGDDRFFLRYTHYDTQQLNAFTNPGGVNNAGGRMGLAETRVIWNALIAAGAVAAADAPFGGDLDELFWSAASHDEWSQGYEISLIANPTKNWTLRATYARTNRERASYFPEGYTYFAKWYPEWRSLAAGNPTLLALVEDNIASIDEELEDLRISRLESYGQVPHKATVTTRYRFSEGRFKGAFIGGAVRYRSKSVGGLSAGDPERLDVNESVQGDVFAGYRFRLGREKGIHATVQLNVRNVTNSYIFTTNRWREFDGVLYPSRLLLSEPRSWRLTTTVEF